MGGDPEPLLLLSRAVPTSSSCPFRWQARKETQQELSLVLVHEQDPAKGTCPFRTFFEQTPEELQKKHRLYDTLAIVRTLATVSSGLL